MKTYEQVHAGLLYVRGSATDQPCVRCGDTKKRHQWAYQHNAGDAELTAWDGRPYSENLEDHYAPMCRPCHNWLDGPKDGRYTKSRESRLARCAVDPEFAERERQQVLAFGRKGQEAVARRRREDPEFAAKMLDNLAAARAKRPPMERKDGRFVRKAES